ncbi:MAG: HAD family hydrolase [Streptococcus sp.]
MVFDKTGTLTKGSFAVSEIHPNGIKDIQLLELAAYAEDYSNHPISLSIKRHTEKRSTIIASGIFKKLQDTVCVLSLTIIQFWLAMLN